MRQKQILILSYYFPRGTAVGSRRILRFIRDFPTLGLNPVVVTAREEYYDSLDYTAEVPKGVPVVRVRVLSGLRQILLRLKRLISRRRSNTNQRPLIQKEEPYKIPSHVSWIKRVLFSLFWFPDDLHGWIFPAAHAALKIARKADIDILFSSGPPFSTHIAGLIVNRITHLPWVVDFRDPWRGGKEKPFYVRTWLSDLVEGWLEEQVLKHAMLNVCMCERQRERLLREHPKLDPNRVAVVPNGYDLREFTSLQKIYSEEKGPFILTYAGNLYNARNPRFLFKAVHDLLKEEFFRPEDIRIRFLGKTSFVNGISLLDLANSYKLGGIVECWGQIPRWECLKELRKSSALFLLAMEQKDQVPAKLYEYLMCEKPILAFTEEDSATSMILRETCAGYIVQPDNLVAIRNIISRLLRNHLEGLDEIHIDPETISRYSSDFLAAQLVNLICSRLNKEDQDGFARVYNKNQTS